MQSLLHHTTENLRTRFTPAESRDLAFWIIEEITGLSRAEILTSQSAVSETIANATESATNRVLAGEPVQYVFGHTLWMGLDLLVSPSTLIPRPETAGLIDYINSRLSLPSTINTPPSTLSILDIGTGSGCIAIALKKQHPAWQVDACDFSSEALQVAEENARRNNADVHFFRCDILRSIPAGSYDLIISNPPYVCEGEKVSMESRVLDYEPASALFVPNDDPLLFYRRIASLASDGEIGLLRPGGQLYFEINERFGNEMATLLHNQGFVDVEIRNDMYGKPRYVAASIPSSPKQNTSLFSRAAAYCSTAERCRQEVKTKLLEWGDDSKSVDEVLERLEKEGFLNETRYARAFAGDKVRFQRWGRLKIRQGLVQKGLPAHLVNEVLTHLDEHDYQQALLWCLDKKSRELKGEQDEQKKRAKLWRFLASRGFTDAEIASVI